MTTFKPADEAEDKKMHRGHDVPNYCINCRQPYHAHHNGVCPKED